MNKILKLMLVVGIGIASQGCIVTESEHNAVVNATKSKLEVLEQELNSKITQIQNLEESLSNERKASTKFNEKSLEYIARNETLDANFKKLKSDYDAKVNELAETKRIIDRVKMTLADKEEEITSLRSSLRTAKSNTKIEQATDKSVIEKKSAIPEPILADSLLNEFSTNQIEANEKYIGKSIYVKCIISKIESISTYQYKIIVKTPKGNVVFYTDQGASNVKTQGFNNIYTAKFINEDVAVGEEFILQGTIKDYFTDLNINLLRVYTQKAYNNLFN